MEYKRIEELTTVVTGGTPSTGKREYWDGGNIPWLQSGCCQNCDVNSTEKYITQEGYDNSSARIMPANTVMIALTGATAGKVGYLNFEACGNQSITGIFPCNSMNQRYLFYYLLSQREKILTDCVGGAQAHISQGYVKNIKVPVLPLSEQKQIVEVLTKLSTVISMQQNEIKTLDNLVKARFVEMFGDPYTNSKDYPLKKGESFFKLSNGKAVPESKRLNGGIPAYGGNGISWYTDESLFDADTIVVGRVGFQSGNVHLVKGPLWVTDNAMYMSSCDFSQYNLTFLIELMAHVDFTKFQDAGDLKKITQKPFMQFEYLCPPLSLQNQFAAFVAEVDKSKLFAELFAQSTCILAENRSK